MTSYRDGIKPWAIFTCQLGKYSCVGRFYNRPDAEHHLNFLRKSIPSMKFELMFDNQPQRQEVTQG